MPQLRLTRFDLIVLMVAAVLLVIIGLTAALGITETPLRVAYLKLGEQSRRYDVWMADPLKPGSAKQVTFADSGVFDYDVSPDGQYIVYSERDFDTGIADLKLLDLRTKDTRTLTNCIMQDSDCSNPEFRPDGQVIAYVRVQMNTGIGTGVGGNRIWLLDLSTEPPSTYPLFDDTQILGYGPVWSADGSHLAFYDAVNSGVLIYNFNANETAGEKPLNFVATQYGEVGTLSPDGTQLIFPEMLLDSQRTRSYLQIADLDTGLFEPVSEPDAVTDDQQPVWNPEGRYVAIGRQFWDEVRYTRGHQTYLIDLQEQTITPLLLDEKYSHAFPEWSLDGQWLAVQRFPQLDDEGNIVSDGTTQVWAYNMETRQLMMVDDNARNPKWVAGSE